MPFGIVFNLDTKAESIVRQTWARFAAAGLNQGWMDGRSRPHITLIIGDEIDLKPLQHAIEIYCTGLRPFSISLASIGSFPTAEGVLFLGVTATSTLLEIHAGLCREFYRYARGINPYYRIGTWIPHCTLAIGLNGEGMSNAHQLAQNIRLPLISNINEIGILEVQNGTSRSLASIFLS